MKLILLALTAVSVSVPVEGKQSAAPIAPGMYCQKEPVTGFTGTGHDIPLGDFIMSVEVRRKSGRYAVTIANQMPDNPQVLEAEASDATVLRDGSLAFSFTDNWENKGRARVYRTGKVVLVMIKRAETLGNQIGRNYGTFNVSHSGCSADEFRQLR